VANLTAIDLFCGAGGLSEGFRQAGYEVRVGSDFNEVAGATFESTHKEARFLGGPIQDIPVKAFLKAAHLRRKELDVLVGGPPCQGFSVYNHQRGMHDERSSLYMEDLRIVEGLLPKWVVMENVTGMTSVNGGEAVGAILKGLRKLGYAVGHQVVRAEQYGIPQERRRLVFIGNRVGAPIVYPTPTHGPGLKPFTTVYDAISDLPVLINGQDQETRPYAVKAQTAYQRALRVGSRVATNHTASRLAGVNVERLKHIPPGGSWRDIPFKLLPEGMKLAKRSDHTKRYGRLKWDGLASTIMTKCDPHWGAYFHPDQARAITVREAARFQSFPDWFTFQGSKTDQYVQVGNAVPPMLGKKIAMAIRDVVENPRDLAFLAAAE
jgi:DNA (cytosine-5)-methyltransferase 1